jgi:hypothetical protein
MRCSPHDALGTNIHAVLEAFMLEVPYLQGLHGDVEMRLILLFWDKKRRNFPF